MDTIFALATAPGRAGVSVIRISGTESWSVVKLLCGGLPKPRVASLRRLISQDQGFLDEALVLLFPEKSSFTGEAVAELQLHGSIAIVSAVLKELGKFEGLRPAEPGEFTRRALENDRLDLARVEGLADLIDAETEAQRQQALRVFSGGLGDRCAEWRADLIRAAALIEATIDFVDEEVPVDVSPEVNLLLNKTKATLSKEITGVRISERIRDGFEIAILGPPNVGKSTLLNALAGREAAITSEFAGTTRDVIEVRMDLDGLPVTFLDTAGIRETEDHVESIGIERARARAEKADLRVLLCEPGDRPVVVPVDGDIVVSGKGDLKKGLGLSVSGLTGVGLDSLVAEISDKLAAMAAGASVAIRERHANAMIRAVGYLDSVIGMLDQYSYASDIAAEELRSAVRALDSLVGRVDVENVLDEIFSSFCIGK